MKVGQNAVTENQSGINARQVRSQACRQAGGAHGFFSGIPRQAGHQLYAHGEAGVS